MFRGGSSRTSSSAVESLVTNLAVATSTETTANTSHFPSDLSVANAVAARVVDFLLDSVEQDDSSQPLPFTEVRVHKLWSTSCPLLRGGPFLGKKVLCTMAALF